MHWSERHGKLFLHLTHWRQSGFSSVSMTGVARPEQCGIDMYLRKYIPCAWIDWFWHYLRNITGAGNITGTGCQPFVKSLIGKHVDIPKRSAFVYSNGQKDIKAANLEMIWETSSPPSQMFGLSFLGPLYDFVCIPLQDSRQVACPCIFFIQSPSK